MWLFYYHNLAAMGVSPLRLPGKKARPTMARWPPRQMSSALGRHSLEWREPSRLSWNSFPWDKYQPLVQVHFRHIPSWPQVGFFLPEKQVLFHVEYPTPRQGYPSSVSMEPLQPAEGAPQQIRTRSLIYGGGAGLGGRIARL